MTTTQSLTEGWALYTGGLELRRHDTPLWTPVRPSGSVWRDLLEAGFIADPAWRDNRQRLERELTRQAVYRCVFCPEDRVLESEMALIRFLCLKGQARVELNGMPLGRTHGLRREWEFPVTDLLRPGENCLTVEVPPGAMALCGPVELLGVTGPRVLGVRISQRMEEGRMVLGLSPELSGSGGEYTAELIGPEGEVLCCEASPKEIWVDKPRLWWPRGYGGQPLYELRITVTYHGAETDCWRRRIGLRTATVEAGGGGFAHMVNGLKIFAMGAAMAPDGPMGREPGEALRLARDCAAANFNCLRVPADCALGESFYDECDRLGLLVWQDVLPELGGGWELTPELAQDIRARGAELGRKLGHHACIGLFCGGDGAEESPITPRQRGDYIRVYEYILPKTIWEWAPEAFYWPSSPSSGGGLDDPNSPERGDFRLEGPVENTPRYVSKLGEPGCSELETLLNITAPEDRSLTSRVMEGHMGPGIAGRMLELVHTEMPLPSSFEGAVYASRLVQGRSTGRTVEALRRERGRCMGTLARQVDEVWPGASFASVDYTGRWKALHYFLRRAFAPVIISCRAEAGDKGCAATVWVVNETRRSRQVIVKLSLRGPLGQVKGEETVSLSLPALESIRLDPTPLPDAIPEEDLLSYELCEGGRPVSGGIELFVPARHYPFPDPRLSFRTEGCWLAVTARACAYGVEISGDGELLLSDNYFDMLPGERWVKVLRGQARNIRLRSIYDLK